MSAAVYHNCEWLYEQIKQKCEENGTEYTSRGLKKRVTLFVKGYARQVLKALFSEYSDTGDAEYLAYMKMILSAMRIDHRHEVAAFREGPVNHKIHAAIIDELLLDTDIQMLYELLCIDKERLISKMQCTPGAADEYVEARRAECIKRKETAEPEPEPEPESEQPKRKRKCMTEEEKRERIKAYQKEYQRQYREKMKQKRAREAAKENL